MKCIQEVSVPYCKSKWTQNEKLNTIKNTEKVEMTHILVSLLEVAIPFIQAMSL